MVIMSPSGARADLPARGADRAADREFEPGRVTQPAQAGKGTASFGVARAGLTRHQAESTPDGIVPPNGPGNAGLRAFSGFDRRRSQEPASKQSVNTLLPGFLDAPDGKSTPCHWVIASGQLLLGNCF